MQQIVGYECPWLVKRALKCGGAIWLVLNTATIFASTGSVDPIDRFIETELNRSNVPGASLAIVRNGLLEKAKGYGLADVERNVAATEATVFQWASLTKQFTAEAIMLLVQEGKLRLSDRIATYYRSAPPAWSNITIRHLLTHTSGIKNYTALPDASKTLRKEYHADELIGLVRGLPLDFEPGEKWAYCNTGYYLLSMVIEEVSGRPYGEFLTARIFEPLGMATARANHQLEIIPNRATGYRYASNVLWRSEFVTPSQQGGAGVLVGSVLDLVKWDAALYAEQLLPRSVREEMWTATKLNDGKTAPYGYGWRLGQMRGHRFVAHSGRNYGFTSHFLRLLDDDLTVIVLLNAEGDPEAIARGIAARYVRGLTLATVDPKPDPNPALTKRLEQCLTELAGTKDSELLTGGFRKNFGTSRRRHGALVQDLKTKKSFTFVTSDDPPPGNPEITRMVSYRLTTADSARVYTFALTAAGKIAGLQTED